MSEEVQVLIDQGRQKVMELAISELESRDFTDIDLASFDRLSTQTDGQELLVVFDRSVRYAPLSKNAIHSAEVRLISGSVSWQELENGGDGRMRGFYGYSSQDWDAIDFVIRVIGPAVDGVSIEILEKDDHYAITEESASSYSGYKLSKSTQEIYEEWGEELDFGGPDDSFQEIHWQP